MFGKSRTRRKKVLGNYPYASVIFSITLALFALGIFGLIIIYSGELEKIVRNNIRIQVFLKSDLSDTQRSQIGQNLLSRYFTNRESAADAVQFVSREEAAKTFIKETGEDFKQFLGDNPLKDAFMVRLKPQYHDAASLRKIKTEIEEIGGVFEAHYLENVIDSINKNIIRISLMLAGIIALLFLIVLLLISHAIRLALYSQRFLIRSMQLVGATRWFVQRAFLWRACLYGFIAGLSAVIFLVVLLSAAGEHIPDLTLLQNNERLLLLACVLVFTGVSVAFLSTWRSVSHYMTMSLDELY